MRSLWNHPMALAAAASFVLSLLPWGKYILYPFRLFTTWVHECSHAGAALLVGGEVERLTIAADTSGLAEMRLPKARLSQALVASAGYLGSSGLGCLLYWTSLNLDSRQAHWVLWGIGGAMLLTLLIWVRNAFGAAAVLLMGAGLIALGSSRSLPLARPLLMFLAIQTALNALLDIRVLFGLDRGARSDARTLQSLLWLPAGLWALLWMAASVAMMFWTLRRTL